MANINNAGTKKESKSILSELMFKYLPYWPLFVACTILTLFAAWFYLRTTAPQYEISATIMLKDEKKGSSEGDITKQIDQLAGNKIVENEIEVLQSRTLMTQVARNLHLYASFYEEDKLIPKPAYTSSPIKIEAVNPDALTSTDKIYFTYSSRDSMVAIGTNKYPINQDVKTPFGEVKFVLNDLQTSQPEKPLYFTIAPPNIMAAVLLGSLRTSPSTKQSSVLYLKIRDTHPRRGEDVLNELIAVYNKASLDEKSRLAANTFSFVEERLNIVEKELLDIEKKAQSYKSSREAVDISTQGQLFLKSVNENDQKLGDINMQLAALDQMEKYVRSKGQGGTIMPSTLGLKDPTLPQLVSKLNEEEAKYEKLRLTTGENHPSVLAVEEQINKIKPGILENIQNQRSALQANKLNISSANNVYSSILHSIPQKERELIDINRQQAIKNSLYAFLLTKKEETALSQASHMSDTRVVDKAQSSFGPVSPKSGMIYIVAFVFAMAIPVGFISVKELLNRKILFRHEIEKLTSAPIIGEISYDKSKNPIVIREGQRTFIAEQFRRMRTSLGYLSGKTGKKRILITSSLSGEGKSFVSLNLALSLALTGKKVVLLELDLANPSLSNKMDVDYQTGASTYLWGESEPEDIIRRTAINENLFFIPSGPLPENPSELLMSERLLELFKFLDEAFDIIVVDSAPASLLSDAYILSPLCDVTLYVVKHKFTPKIYLERLDDENDGNKLTNMRIVFNSIQSRGFTQNGYGYGYGYGYIHNDGYHNGKGRKKLKRKSK